MPVPDSETIRIVGQENLYKLTLYVTFRASSSKFEIVTDTKAGTDKNGSKQPLPIYVLVFDRVVVGKFLYQLIPHSHRISRLRARDFHVRTWPLVHRPEGQSPWVTLSEGTPVVRLQ